MFVHIRTRSRFALIGGNLTAQLTGSHRGIGSGINFASTPSLPPRRQRAPESLLADEPGGGGGRREKLISHSRSFFKTIPHPAHLPSLSRAKIWANPAFRVADPTYDWNPGSKFHCQTWNPVAGIRNPRRGMQNPRLSLIPLHGVKLLVKGKITAFCQIS